MNNIIKILIIFMFLNIGIAAAETGSIFLSDTVTKNYIFSSIAGGSGVNFSTIRFDQNNYNVVESFQFLLPSSAAYPFESTTFTIISGGSGGGTAWYDRNISKGYVVFSPESTFTISPVIINYSKKIFDNLTGFGATKANADVGSSTPVCFIFNGGDGTCYGALSYTDVQVALEATDFYSVSYPINGYFSISITKNDKISSKYFINSYNTEQRYSEESTYNKININNAIFQYGAGISLNTTLSSGYYVRTMINSTGCSSCIVPEVRTYPTTGANVYTDKASYVVGDNIYVEWFIADDPYTNTLSSCEFLINDEIIASSIHQNDNYTILKPSIGIQKIQIGCGVFSSPIVGEISVSVIAESQSYLTLQNGTAKAGSLNNFTYKWGFTPSSYRWLNIYKFDVVKNAWVKESSNSIQLASTANVVYTSQALIKSDGKYYAEICDNTKGCPTVKILFNSVYEANIPIYSYAFSNISITNRQTTYAQNDWLAFNTRIDGVNFSSGKSFSVRLNNPATTTNKTLQYIHTEYEDNNVYLDSSMESGNLWLQLVGTNSTGTYVFNQTPITISLLDANGFALYANKYNNVCPKESVIITAISPQNSVITISVAPIKRYNFTGSKTVEIKGTSDYTVSLDTQGTQNKLISIFVNNSCVLDTSKVPGTPTTPQTMNNLVSFLSMPAFWGILLFIVCVIGTAWKAPGAVGIVALIVSNLEAIIGLWSPYTIYVLLVTWIIAAIFFTIGRRAATGGE